MKIVGNNYIFLSEENRSEEKLDVSSSMPKIKLSKIFNSRKFVSLPVLLILGCSIVLFVIGLSTGMV